MPPRSAPRDAETPRQRRFYGKVTLNHLRIGRDAGAIADEIVAHLTKFAGADVEVTLEIHATIPEGVPEATIRTVLENARTS